MGLCLCVPVLVLLFIKSRLFYLPLGDVQSCSWRGTFLKISSNAEDHDLLVEVSLIGAGAKLCRTAALQEQDWTPLNQKNNATVLWCGSLTQQRYVQQHANIILNVFREHGSITFSTTSITHCLCCESFCRSQRRSTPKFPVALQLRSISLRCEGFDFRAKTKSARPSSPILHQDNLQIAEVTAVWLCYVCIISTRQKCLWFQKLNI